MIACDPRNGTDWNKLRRIAFAALVGLLGAASVHGGTVATDGSVGARTNLAGPTFNIPAALGQQKGGNLFHSFSTFNLSTGDTASFTGPLSVSNVIARVTGGTASNLNGTLQCTIPGANLYFINPAGVVFGANAALDVKGSFIVTTADYVKFADGKQFNATHLADSVLTSAAPTAFGFMAANPPKDIAVKGAELDVPSGKVVSLVGGSVTIVNGVISAPGGRVNLIGASSPAELKMDAASVLATIDLTPPTAGAGDIALSRNSAVITDGSGGGRITVIGGDLTMDASVLSARATTSQIGRGIDVAVGAHLTLNDAEIFTDTLGAGKSGPISISAEQIIMDAGGDTANLTGISAQGNTGAGGDIAVNAAVLQMNSRTQITVDTSGNGAGGTIKMNVPTMTLDGQGFDRTADSSFLAGTGIFARTISSSSHAGPAGAISISTNALQINSGAAISVESDGMGLAGTVTLGANTITIDDHNLGILTGIFADTSSNKPGPGGGQITLDAQTLTMSNGAFISASSFGAADAGDMALTAGALTMSGQAGQANTAIASTAFASGNAGSIQMQAQSLTVTGNSAISASTLSNGRGGAINIVANGLELDGGSIQAQSTPNLNLLAAGAVPGDAGTISVNSSTFYLHNGGTINAGTAGPGRGGKIIVAGDEFTADGAGTEENTGLFVDSAINPGPFSSIGPAGSIVLSLGSLTLNNGASISASTAGAGAGGNINVTVRGPIAIDGGTSDKLTGILTTANQQGVAGDINVNAVSIGIENNGAISSSAGGTGSAGSVNVTAQGLLLITGASISSDTAGTGAGGNVAVNLSGPLVIDGHDVIAFTGISADSLSSGAGGNAGQVAVTADSITIQNTGRIATNTLGLGAGGNITVNAANIFLDESPADRFTGISSLSESTGLGGRSGDVTVNASISLHITNGARISAETTGQGDGGNVTISAGTLAISNPGDQTNAGIVTDSTADGAGGHAGNILVSANFLNITSTGEISSSTFGKGDGGNVTVAANQMVLDASGEDPQTHALFGASLTGIAASSQNLQKGGKAGDIAISADSLQVLNGAQISSATFGLGAGGAVNITANHLMVAGLSSLDSGVSSTIGSTSDSPTGGNAGTVTIKAGDAAILDSGEINDETTGTGNGGAISLLARTLRLDHNAAIIGSSTGSGIAGTIILNLADSLKMTRFATISTEADISTGGDVTLFAGHSVLMSGLSAITAQAGGPGGSVQIKCPGTIHLIDSLISTQGGGNGGNMRVDPSFVILENSQLSANGGNNGGNISVRPDFLLINQSLITATGKRGVSGSVQVTPDYNLTGALLSLPVSLSDSLTLQPQCAADLPGAISSFIVTGRGGVPMEPGGWDAELELRLPAAGRKR